MSVNIFFDYTYDRRGLQSPVRGASRGNTPDPAAVHPEVSPSSLPERDDESTDESRVSKVYHTRVLSWNISQ